MNKKIWLFAGIFLCVIVSGALYLYLMPAQPSRTTLMPEREVVDTQTAPPTAPKTTAHARYITYSEDAFRQDNTATKILFFYADWCPKCRALDTDLQAHVSSLGDLVIYKVDYDREIALRKQYGVTIQTTLVKTNQIGEKLVSYVAYDNPTVDAIRQGLEL